MPGFEEACKCCHRKPWDQRFRKQAEGAMSEPILECRKVWKVYGENPKAFMARHNGNPSPEAAAQEGYITAVRDASIAVYPGEILIIMGLSGSGKSSLALMALIAVFAVNSLALAREMNGRSLAGALA